MRLHPTSFNTKTQHKHYTTTHPNYQTYHQHLRRVEGCGNNYHQATDCVSHTGYSIYGVSHLKNKKTKTTTTVFTRIEAAHTARWRSRSSISTADSQCWEHTCECRVANRPAFFWTIQQCPASSNLQ